MKTRKKKSVQKEILKDVQLPHVLPAPRLDPSTLFDDNINLIHRFQLRKRFFVHFDVN